MSDDIVTRIEQISSLSCLSDEDSFVLLNASKEISRLRDQESKANHMEVMYKTTLDEYSAYQLENATRDFKELEKWKTTVENKLAHMIKDWESRIPENEDDTLYSLALRRALDVVLGVDPDLGP